MTQIETLLELEKSNLTFDELVKATGNSKSNARRKLQVLKSKGQVVRARGHGLKCHYEITDKGKERLKKVKELKP